jgi:hypothetical protein
LEFDGDGCRGAKDEEGFSSFAELHSIVLFLIVDLELDLDVVSECSRPSSAS